MVQPKLETAESKKGLNSSSPANFSLPMKAEFQESVIETLSQSDLYREYEKAFAESTGLPVALRSAESWHLPHHGRVNENKFCAMMAGKSKSCAACLQLHQKLTDSAVDGPATLACSAGLSDTAVPVKAGGRVIGFLQTGQAFREKPDKVEFPRMYRQIREWGVEATEKEVHEAWAGSKVLGEKQYDAAVKLLEIFARHLSMMSNQILVQHEHSEPPMIKRAREFIETHITEELSLEQVARAVHASSFYFCKMFKKYTGLNFTDFVSRTRIERAKNLLLNPNLRISEIAFEVGFQSLTHFNRVFKKVVGESPSDYRSKLPVFFRR